MRMAVSLAISMSSGRPSFAQIHDEPHSLDCVAGVHVTTLEAVAEGAVGEHVLHNESAKLRTDKYVTHFVKEVVGSALESIFVEEVLYFERKIAQNHRQSEVLEIARTGVELVPLALGLSRRSSTLFHALSAISSYSLLPGGLCQLAESHCGEGVGEDIVRLDQRLALAGGGK